MGKRLWIIVLLGSTTLARAEQRLRFDVPFATDDAAASEALDDEPAWLALGNLGRTRAAVTAERHVVLELERGPFAFGLSNVLDRAWRVEAFEDASRAGAQDHRLAMEALPSSLTASATLTLDY